MQPPPPGQPYLNSEGMPRPGDAAEQVNIPAIALIALAALSAAYGLFGLFGGAKLMAGMLQNYPGLPPEMKDALREAKNQGINPVQVIISLVQLAGDALVIFGAIQMRSLKMWGLGMAASIIVMIPCFTSCCCLPGLAVGIWSLVVLNKPEVKSAFT